MDLQLQGKRVLVTGSSGGIGEGIAKYLAREGVVIQFISGGQFKAINNLSLHANSLEQALRCSDSEALTSPCRYSCLTGLSCAIR